MEFSFFLTFSFVPNTREEKEEIPNTREPSLNLTGRQTITIKAHNPPSRLTTHYQGSSCLSMITSISMKLSQKFLKRFNPLLFMFWKKMY